MSATLAPPPLQTPIVEVRQAPGVVLGAMTKAFEHWLRSLVNRAQVAAFAVITIALTGQSASIAATDLVPSAAAGLYRVTYRFRVSTAATTSSSLQITVSSTEGGIACQQSSAAYTGNVTNRPQSGSFLVHADGSSPITYATTYASVGATVMVYELDVTVEQM